MSETMGSNLMSVLVSELNGEILWHSRHSLVLETVTSNRLLSCDLNCNSCTKNSEASCWRVLAKSGQTFPN